MKAAWKLLALPVCGLLALSAVVLASEVSPEQDDGNTKYKLTDLGFTAITGRINDAGEFFGSDGVTGQAFVWKDGHVADLPTLGGYPFQTGASAINDRGDLIGVSAVSTSGPPHSVLWRQGKTIVDLGTLFSASDLNDRSQVVGFLEVSFANYHAAIWDRGKLTDIGTFDTSLTIPRAINDGGLVAGDYGGPGAPPGELTRAFIWERGEYRDLGTLGGSYAAARDMNNSGQVVGVSTTASGTVHAFLWEEGKMTDLGDFSPFHINNRGQILGFLESSSNPVHDVLWQHGRLTDLNGLLGNGRSFVATGINNGGEIIGYELSGIGNPGEVFLATPGDDE
jgi:probable HAF family extracellular repeat protein